MLWFLYERVLDAQGGNALSAGGNIYCGGKRL
jgi:hypothetical protein